MANLTGYWNNSNPGVTQNGKFRTDPTAFADPNAARNRFDLQFAQANMVDPAQALAAANEQMRGRQVGFLDAIEARARGTAPSIADMQYRMAADRGAAQAQSLAKGAIAQGMAPGQALAMAMNAGAEQNQALAGQAAIDRLREQEANQGMFMQALGGIRGQDLANRAQQDALRQFYTGATLGLDSREADRRMAYEGQRQDWATTQAQLSSQEKMAKMQADAQRREWYERLLGAGVSAGGSLLTSWLTGGK